MSSNSSYISDGEDYCDYDLNGDEMESLIVVRHNGSKSQTKSTTSLVPEKDDGEHV